MIIGDNGLYKRVTSVRFGNFISHILKRFEHSLTYQF